jgi:indole-3-glycerol phosphate synthase
MNRLEEILRVKRAEVERLLPRKQELQRLAMAPGEFRGFRSALKRRDDQIAIIAEIKKASPSAGLIAESFDPIVIAESYERSGAEAISVLTDQIFFQGSLTHLMDVRSRVSLPILRNDFIIDEIQIAESVVAGADAVLLIVAGLEGKKLLALSEAVARYHLDALVEVHTAEDLDRALDIGAQIIGINNRNLSTFEVDLSVTEQLSELVPDDVVLVSESGFKSVEDVARAERCGVDAILIGEALMRGEISIPQLRNL